MAGGRELDRGARPDASVGLNGSRVRWAIAGPSELQLRDVAGMVAIAGDKLDLVYLLAWIRVLGLEDAWRSVSNWT